jgi:hypothetical protein
MLVDWGSVRDVESWVLGILRVLFEGSHGEGNYSLFMAGGCGYFCMSGAYCVLV